MAANLTTVKRVAILSTNGTGRVTGYGTVIAPWGIDIVVVERDNGRRIAINTSLLRAAA